MYHSVDLKNTLLKITLLQQLNSKFMYVYDVPYLRFFFCLKTSVSEHIKYS